MTKPRVALVTGAGRSVGLGIARRLAAAGAIVAVNDLHPQRASDAAAQIVAAGGRAQPFAFDVTDYGAVHDAVAHIARDLGPVEILVNNAGITEGSATWQFLGSHPDQWRASIELNMFGSMNCIHAVLPAMVEAGWGRIIQISSGAGSTGLAIGVSVYGAAKAGIEGLLRHLSMELRGTGITVNSLALGLMENVAPGVQAGRLDGLLRGVPVGRLGTPEEIGGAVLWLSGDDGSFVTGQTIHINGGSISGR